VRHGGKVYKLGTVCVLDRAPRAHFSVRDKQVWVPTFLSLLNFFQNRAFRMNSRASFHSLSCGAVAV
jgi:hypothetical protein